MSASYRAVQWNRHKRIYDACIAAGVALFVGAFLIAGKGLFPGATAETLIIRALGACAFLMLHVILAIGPLARLNPRFLPLLYNRRHLGVAMCLVALAHAVFSIAQWHAFGDLNPLVSLLTANTRAASLSQFPFEWLGLGALLILLLMAATSHDFWLANLSPRVWKTLHMLVYVAHALLVMHVALGFLQSETSPAYPVLLAAGLAALIALHLAAGVRERRADQRRALPRARTAPAPPAPFIDVCAVADIAPDRAVVVCLPGARGNARAERIAVFRHGPDGRRVSAVSNVCAHQQGPLGEGRVIDGCITCPWHGYQYQPHNGQSPPPFTERIPTYDVRIVAGRVHVNPAPNPPGTPVAPAHLEVHPT